jgi:hypothetical protein
MEFMIMRNTVLNFSSTPAPNFKWLQWLFKFERLRIFYYFLCGKIFAKREVITLFIGFALSFVFKSLNDN